ncbi:MAG: recombination-associated protein RdgC [Desulfomonilaceae bacterium]
MGFGSRSVSMIRYRVRGEMDGSFWETVEAGVRRGAFQEVQTSGDEVGMGWVSIDDFTDSLFAGTSYVRGNYVAASLRIDTVRVPPRILEIQLKKESRKKLEETGQRRLSSAQRRELKEHLKESLKQQVFPSIQIYDLIWDTAKAVVYFGSHSVKARERMEAHFKKCFGLTLVPILAYIRAEEMFEGKPEKRLLEQLKPCSMAP